MLFCKLIFVGKYMFNSCGMCNRAKKKHLIFFLKHLIFLKWFENMSALLRIEKQFEWM